MGPAAAVSLIQAYYQACLSYLFLRFNASMSILFLLGQKTFAHSKRAGSHNLDIVEDQSQKVSTF